MTYPIFTPCNHCGKPPVDPESLAWRNTREDVVTLDVLPRLPILREALYLLRARRPWTHDSIVYNLGRDLDDGGYVVPHDRRHEWALLPLGTDELYQAVHDYLADGWGWAYLAPLLREG